MFTPALNIEQSAALKDAILRASVPPVRSKRLNRHKVVSGKVYQLHATRGWKCIGRAK